MKGSRAAVVAIAAIVVLGGAWWLFSRGRTASTIDLVEQLATAAKAPAAGTFEVGEFDLNGENKRGVSVPHDARITYKVRVPDDAWLRVSVGARPETWTSEGNGTLFLVGVSDGRTYDELFTQHVNPFGNPGDRKWIQVWVDLSAYAGEEVDLIFNTRSSPANMPADLRNDGPLWGAPEVLVR